ncbi:MAG: hypothetical protein HY868_25785 [Chloroflexi bacterium]|nr:hypothetical protein [Chloroflexota bacterium]
MKKYFLLGLVLTLLTACTSTTTSPTAASSPKAPVSLPTPTAARQPTKALPTGSGIVVRNLQQATQSDGSTRVTANVITQENLGLGQIDLAYSETMLLSDTQRVRLRIAPAQQLVSLTPIPQPTGTPGPTTFVYRFSGNVQLYPVMIAQLRALAFEIDQPGAIRRTLDGTKEIVWDWIVRPKFAGRQDLSLEISIPIIRDGATTEISTDVLQNVPLTIIVKAPDAPTPTPVSPGARIVESLLDNSGAILVAVIGLIGTIIGIWLKARIDAQKKPAK